jgi:hypothetical protein
LRAALIKWSGLLTPIFQAMPLIGFSRQPRGGFTNRGIGKFPVSLVEMRDLKDYITAAKDGIPADLSSSFNVKADVAQKSPPGTKKTESHLKNAATWDAICR